MGGRRAELALPRCGLGFFSLPHRQRQPSSQPAIIYNLPLPWLRAFSLLFFCVFSVCCVSCSLSRALALARCAVYALVFFSPRSLRSACFLSFPSSIRVSCLVSLRARTTRVAVGSYMHQLTSLALRINAVPRPRFFLFCACCLVVDRVPMAAAGGGPPAAAAAAAGHVSSLSSLPLNLPALNWLQLFLHNSNALLDYLS